MCDCCEGFIDNVCRCIPYDVREKIQCCLITFLLVIAAAVVTGVILIIVIFGGPLRKIKITVEDGSLMRFDLLDNTTNMALAYNISLTMSVRNPNWAIGIKHDKPLEAAYTYDGQQFDRVKLADEGDKQAARKTVMYSLDVNSEGRSVSLGNAGEAKFKEEKEKGVFEVELKITGKFKYQLRKTKCEFEATCPVKLQLAKPDTAAVVFQKADCELAKSDDKYCKMVY